MPDMRTCNQHSLGLASNFSASSAKSRAETWQKGFIRGSTRGTVAHCRRPVSVCRSHMHVHCNLSCYHQADISKWCDYRYTATPF